MISGSVSLLCSRFFSPFPHGTGSLSVSREYLALRDGPRSFTQNFSCSALLRCRLSIRTDFAYGTFTLCGPAFQRVLLSVVRRFVGGPTTPVSAVTLPVWAAARSLATTCAITFVFFSSAYLDVSVQRVGSALCAVTRSPVPGCPIRISTVRSGYLPLSVAFRSLSRPSSPPGAQASFMCPSLLSFFLSPFQLWF